MALTPEQVKIVKSTVPVLQEHGNTITTVFYENLLRDIPDLNNIFNQANQRNGHQAGALAGAVYAYAANIDDLGVLSPAVERICQKHASLYIKPEQYSVVGEYLLKAMGEVLGSALTPDILEAWTVAYWQLANLMIKREDEILDSGGSWTDWRDFTIARKVKESDVITSFYLRPVDGEPLPAFRPGQYVSVMTRVSKLDYLQSRQYSLSEAPKTDYYRISVKKELGLPMNTPDAALQHPGYISNVLHDEKKEGDVIAVSHPAGDFFFDSGKHAANAVVLISAGVGLTPMVSILNQLAEQKTRHRISWIHGARTSASQAFGEHVQQVAKSNANISTTVFLGSPSRDQDREGVDYKYAGRVRLDILDGERDLCLDDKNASYFICGPSGFMTSMSTGLQQLGVREEQINMELFGTGSIPS